jgi:hypothetical protein
MAAIMRKLPRRTFDYVNARELTEQEYTKFEFWLKANWKGDYHHWTDNQVILIPYNAYESWVKYESDIELLAAIQELTNRDPQL